MALIHHLNELDLPGTETTICYILLWTALA